MDRNPLIQLAQLRILNQYKLLVDCSTLDEAVLQLICEGKLPVVNEKESPTFARWCDQVFGTGTRVPVARLDYFIAGNTRLSSLTEDLGFSEIILQKEKEQKLALKTFDKKIAKIEIEHFNAIDKLTPSARALDDFSSQLRGWYSILSYKLQELLPKIKEVQGHIYKDSGPSNQDHRACLLEIIIGFISSLESLGMEIVVQLLDVTPEGEQIFLPVHQNNPIVRKENARPLFAFTVQKMPADILTLSQPPHPIRDDAASRMPCLVSVYAGKIEHEPEAELSHLSYVVNKLFVALAKSADNVPRGALREKIILCLILSWSAPCMLPEEGVPLLSPRRSSGDLDGQGTDLCPGEIIQHLRFILQGVI